MTRYTLHHGDCIAVMRTMEDASVDAIVTDPPYHLTSHKAGGRGAASVNDTPFSLAARGGFMGMKWDGGDIAFSVELWTEAMRVLKPGGHLLAFSGTRTQHRMVCAIEDAGFEVRDQIGWAYGSGFPKSRNIAEHDMTGIDAETWAGWGTALKPAWEPICVARKPLAKGLTVAANVLAYGTGAINIDACRVDFADDADKVSAKPGTTPTTTNGNGITHGAMTRAEFVQPAGRWPANIIHDGSAEVVALFPESTSGAVKAGTVAGADTHRGVYGSFDGYSMPTIEASTGSAARFFYCAKASRTDRNEGLASSNAPVVETDATMRDCETADWSTRNGNHHPTVKPTDLMAYLARLVTPPGGLVLDPFMGSGSTGKACMREGMRFVGIDLGAEYIEIARTRIEHELAKVTAAKESELIQGKLFA